MKLQRFRVVLALFASVMAVGLAACTVTRNWQYPPDPPGTLLNVKGAKTLPVTVAVLPLRDLRGANVERGSWRMAFPLVPYAVNSFDRPETVQDPEGVPLIHMNPSRDFAMAIANELRHAGIFSRVALAESLSTKPDLVLSGTIRSTNWRRSYTTYGLGPIGPLFWILGAPMGKATNTVAMDLQLTPANDPSRLVWQFTMDFEDSHLFGVYYGQERSVENYANAVQETLKPAISNLVKIATEHPELLRPDSATGVSMTQSH
ncbi:MAG: hypothetical protein E6K59_01565 [Nitrospirae bacterium]|nr:MAG: hypothetical protein E6K59_01565 [Nitrospirota bacterium]